MGAIDFTEIPSAKGGQPDQNAWEFFARDFFDARGFKIRRGPARGPDGGRDLLVVESRIGVESEEEFVWLVSAKHYAHSGSAVSAGDEEDPLGRLNQHGVGGFIAFYSTLPSTSLEEKLKTVERAGRKLSIYDRSRIEKILIENPALKMVVRRYFPKSLKKWRGEATTPTTIWDSYSPLNCKVCDKDLLLERSGIVALVTRFASDNALETLDVYWACKGECDGRVQAYWRAKGHYSHWEDISTIAVPLLFMRWVMASLNNIRSGGERYTDTAFEKFKEFTLAVAQLVVRETSEEEREMIEQVKKIPEWLGGLG